MNNNISALPPSNSEEISRSHSPDCLCDHCLRRKAMESAERIKLAWASRDPYVNEKKAFAEGNVIEYRRKNPPPSYPWTATTAPGWHPMYDYRVQPDPYAHLRAALAAGKRVIYISPVDGHRSKPLTFAELFHLSSPPECYEIEPDQEEESLEPFDQTAKQRKTQPEASDPFEKMEKAYRDNMFGAVPPFAILPPQEPKPIALFDVVRLKSGGPAMTVMKLIESASVNGSQNEAECLYIFNGEMSGRILPVGALVHFQEKGYA